MGGLLAVPQALPDDDHAAETISEAPEVVPESPRLVEETTTAPSPLKAVEPEPAPAQTSAVPTRAVPAAPSTLRVNDAAGKALWEAFLVAKHVDPFLSYRQFA